MLGRRRDEPLLTREEIDGAIVLLMRIDDGVRRLIDEPEDEEDDGEAETGSDA